MAKRKQIPQLPKQFWAVVYYNRLVGPFTDIEIAKVWAATHECTQMMNIYAPHMTQLNIGHDMGHFLMPKEMV